MPLHSVKLSLEGHRYAVEARVVWITMQESMSDEVQIEGIVDLDTLGSIIMH